MFSSNYISRLCLLLSTEEQGVFPTERDKLTRGSLQRAVCLVLCSILNYSPRDGLVISVAGAVLLKQQLDLSAQRLYLPFDAAAWCHPSDLFHQLFALLVVLTDRFSAQRRAGLWGTFREEPACICSIDPALFGSRSKRARPERGRCDF